jgi:thiosulfate dehydrogenase
MRAAPVFGAAACLLLQAACETGEAPAAPPSVVQRTAVQRGALLFEDKAVSDAAFNPYTCATCHAVAADSTRTVPGAPMAGVVARPSFWGGHEVDLLRAVNHCLRWFMLQDEPWTGDEPQAQDIYAYLESLAAPPGEPEPAPFTVVVEISDVAAGDAGQGEAVYARACGTCHGAPHSGDGRLVPFAAVLPEDVLADHPLGEYTAVERRLVVIEKIRHGRFLGYEGQMPPFSREVLSDEDIGALLTFLGI